MSTANFNPTSENLAKERQSVLDVGQRNQLESVQAEVRRNNELLTTLRRENKELQVALQQTQRGQTNVTIDDHYEKEEELLHNKMAVLKRSINAVKAKNVELTKEIDKVAQETAVVQQEGGAGLDEGSPIAQKIRALENRLDKCLVKHNEVNAIRQTYETLLERLQLEQGNFDTQLASTEKALQQSKKELNDLKAVGNDAAKERDQAKAEVNRLKNKLMEDRKVQRKTTEEKRGFVQEKRDALERKNQLLLQKMSQQEERHNRALAAAATQNQKKSKNRSGASSVALRPEEQQEIESQREAYLRLRDITVASNVADVIAKLKERRENNANLVQSTEQLKSAIQGQKQTREQLHRNWDKANTKAGGAMVSARTTRNARDERLRAARDVDENLGGGEDEGTHNHGILGDGKDYRLLPERPREETQVVAEFRSHLVEREGELKEANVVHDRLSQLLADVDVGVQHMADKLAITHDETTAANPTGVSAKMQLETAGVSAVLSSATSSADLLRSCDAKLQLLLEELSPEEIQETQRAMAQSKVMMPDTNVRVPALARQLQRSTTNPSGGMDGEGTLTNHHSNYNNNHTTLNFYNEDSEDSDSEDGGMKVGNKGGNNKYGMVEDFPDNEIHSRYELKMMSRATVEREEKKARKAQQQRRKEETM